MCKLPAMSVSAGCQLQSLQFRTTPLKFNSEFTTEKWWLEDMTTFLLGFKGTFQGANRKNFGRVYTCCQLEPPTFSHVPRWKNKTPPRLAEAPLKDEDFRRVNFVFGDNWMVEVKKEMDLQPA